MRHDWFDTRIVDSAVGSEFVTDTIYVPAGTTRLKVAIAWSSNPGTQDQLFPGSATISNDFDLRLPDRAGDLIPNPFDNCPGVANEDQRDGDGDLTGDACEAFFADGFESGDVGAWLDL